jgi:hypothetical protein
MVSYVESFGEKITKIPTKPLIVKMLEERQCCLRIEIPEAETGLPRSGFVQRLC